MSVVILRLFKKHIPAIPVNHLVKNFRCLSMFGILFLLCVHSAAQEGKVEKLPSGLPQDMRPKFDKSVFHKTLWFQHQLESITRSQAHIAPDRNLIKSYGDEVADFTYMADLSKQAGASGFIFHDAYPFEKMMGNVLEGFRRSGSGLKAICVDNTIPALGKLDDVVSFYVKWLLERKPIYTAENYLQIDGKPVIVLFNGPRTAPELWAKALPEIEKQAYPCIWLYNSDPPLKEKMVRDWVGLMDGFMEYGWGGDYDKVSAILRHYPGKVFMANAMPKVQHDSMMTGIDGGFLTRLFRENLRIAVAANPDAISVSDFAEYGHQSMFGPSYQLWDSYWRIMKEFTGPFIGRKPVERKSPELIVTKKMDILVGDALEIEVLGFVMPKANQAVTIDLRLVNTRGEELFRFPERNVTLDTTKEELFTVSTIAFYQNLAVYPVLRYRWNNQTFGPIRFRPTRLWVGNSPTDMVWSAPADRIDMTLTSAWSAEILNSDGTRILEPGAKTDFPAQIPSVGDGGVVLLPENVPDGITLHRWLQYPQADTMGLKHYSLLENGYRYSEFGNHYSFSKTWLDYFPSHNGPPLRCLELEAYRTEMHSVPAGKTPYISEQPTASWTSLPIYVVTDPSTIREVSVPVAVQDIEDTKARELIYAKKIDTRWPAACEKRIKEVRTITVPEYRIPYFDYKFDSNRLPMAFDSSGFRHHGWIGYPKTGHFGGGFDHEIGYYFRNVWTGNWPLPRNTDGSLAPRSPEFCKDATFGGYLRFDGKEDWVLLPSRTQMPFASTIELIVRREDTGRKMIVYCGQGNGGNRDGEMMKLRIGFDENGRALAETPETKQTIVSDQPVPPQKLVNLAVVDDCKEITLYVDGIAQAARAKSSANNMNRVYTFVHLGLNSRALSNGSGFWNLANAADFFKGDLARVRITGRPLQPKDFISSEAK